MNLLSTNKGTSLSLMIAVGFTSGLFAAELHDSSQPNNGLTPAQPQLVEAEACPYPPQTPAAAGTEAEPPKALPPRSHMQPSYSVRPAVYIELLLPAVDGDKVILSI